ncbi:MAG: ABC transporter ATP-binding protein [Gemmatimonas sp.]
MDLTGNASQAFLRIDGVSKRFRDTIAVDGVSLDIARGTFFSLLGASGSGKTTLLRILAGFETPDTGRVLIDGEDVTDIPPHRRPVNMMFQSYALFPHMTVAENVAFGLRQDGMAKPQRDDRVAEMLALVRMQGYESRKPHQLSGGQRQRIALARALAKQPKLLLLDEPMAALDRKLREETQLELAELQRRLGLTFVMVTHDQDEAMTMSDRLAVMEKGRVLQVGTPAEVYESPRSRHVAEFLGAANVFEGRVLRHRDGHTEVRCAGVEIALLLPSLPQLREGDAIAFAVRPEKISVDTAPRPGDNALAGELDDVAYKGDVSIVHVRLSDGRRVRVQETNVRRDAAGAQRGQKVWLRWRPDDSAVLGA